MLSTRFIRSALKKTQTAKGSRQAHTSTRVSGLNKSSKAGFASFTHMPAVALGLAAGAAAAYTFSQYRKEEEKKESLFDNALSKLLMVAAADEKVPLTGIPGTKFERTFIAFKPDTVQRNLIGELIGRFEAKGFKLVGIKIMVPTEQFAAKHYDDLKARPFFPGLCKYFSSGAVVAMVWEGKNAVVGGRKLVGATNPNDAAPGSIRGDFAIDVGRNLIHGSDSNDSAKHEIALWFTEAEVANYNHDTGLKWVYEK